MSKQVQTPIAKHKEHTSLWEKISYALYFLGQNIIYFLVVSFLLIYYTDFALIPVAITTILITVTKVWDAINDPIFGTVVDNMEMKSGKFKPWILISSILLPFVTIAMFAIPNSFPSWAKVVMACVTYLLWDIAYTISDVPAFAISTVMTDNIGERNKLMSFNRFGAMIGVFGVMVLAPKMFAESGPLKTVTIWSLIAVVTMIPVAFVAKERFVTKKSEIDESLKEDEGSFKEMYKYLRSNKYLFIFFLGIAIQNIVTIGLTPYISTVIFGDLGVQGILSLFSIPPIFLGFIITPLLLKKFDKIVLFRACIIFGLVTKIIMFIFGFNGVDVPNIMTYGMLSFLNALPSGITMVLMYSFTGDTIEYGQYMSGVRKEGISFAIQTFTAKLGGAAATGITSLILLLISYQPNLASYPTEFSKLLWFVNFIIPFIGNLLALPVFFQYHLTNNDVQVMADINTGRITEEEGTKLLSRKYK